MPLTYCHDSQLEWGKRAYYTVKLLRSAHTFSCVLAPGVLLPLFGRPLQNKLIIIFGHLKWHLLSGVGGWLVFVFSNTTTSFDCSSIISELFIYYIK